MNTDANKIVLPDFLIADLYKSCLVHSDSFANEKNSLAEEKKTAEAQPVISADKLKYLGENLKNIVIIVNQPNSIHVNKSELTFLTNILKACQLNINDIAIINVAEQKVIFTEVKEQLSAMQIILFDVEPSFIRLPFTIPPFQVQSFADAAIMLAPSLSALNKPDSDGRLLKTKLWNSLKQIFKIS